MEASLTKNHPGTASPGFGILLFNVYKILGNTHFQEIHVLPLKVKLFIVCRQVRRKECTGSQASREPWEVASLSLSPPWPPGDSHVQPAE